MRGEGSQGAGAVIRIIYLACGLEGGWEEIGGEMRGEVRQGSGAGTRIRYLARSLESGWEEIGW